MKVVLFALLFLFVAEINAQDKLVEFQAFEQNVSRKNKITTDRSIVTIERQNQNKKQKNGDILLTKKDFEGNVIWSKFYGGSGYEYIGSFLQTADRGFVIVGTTSSYGEGNNNVFLIKTDENGNEIWSKTYGGFFNEYGYYVKESDNGDFLIKGKKQFCEGDNVPSNCFDKSWFIRTNASGELLDELITELRPKKRL